MRSELAMPVKVAGSPIGLISLSAADQSVNILQRIFTPVMGNGRELEFGNPDTAQSTSSPLDKGQPPAPEQVNLWSNSFKEALFQLMKKRGTRIKDIITNVKKNYQHSPLLSEPYWYWLNSGMLIGGINCSGAYVWIFDEADKIEIRLLSGNNGKLICRIELLGKEINNIENIRIFNPYKDLISADQPAKFAADLLKIISEKLAVSPEQEPETASSALTTQGKEQLKDILFKKIGEIELLVHKNKSNLTPHIYTALVDYLTEVTPLVYEQYRNQGVDLGEMRVHLSEALERIVRRCDSISDLLQNGARSANQETDLAFLESVHNHLMGILKEDLPVFSVGDFENKLHSLAFNVAKTQVNINKVKRRPPGIMIEESKLDEQEKSGVPIIAKQAFKKMVSRLFSQEEADFLFEEGVFVIHKENNSLYGVRHVQYILRCDEVKRELIRQFIDARFNSDGALPLSALQLYKLLRKDIVPGLISLSIDEKRRSRIDPAKDDATIIKDTLREEGIAPGHIEQIINGRYLTVHRNKNKKTAIPLPSGEIEDLAYSIIKQARDPAGKVREQREGITLAWEIADFLATKDYGLDDEIGETSRFHDKWDEKYWLALEKRLGIVLECLQKKWDNEPQPYYKSFMAPLNQFITGIDYPETDKALLAEEVRSLLALEASPIRDSQYLFIRFSVKPLWEIVHETSSSALKPVKEHPANASRTIMDVQRISRPYRISANNKNELPMIVEEPLLEAARILYDKGIQMYSTSANKRDLEFKPLKGDANSYAHIAIMIDYLSEENRSIVDSLFSGEIKYKNKNIKMAKATPIVEQGMDYYSLNLAYILMSITEKTTIEEIREESVFVANQFVSQASSALVRLKPWEVMASIYELGWEVLMSHYQVEEDAQIKIRESLKGVDPEDLNIITDKIMQMYRSGLSVDHLLSFALKAEKELIESEGLEGREDVQAWLAAGRLLEEPYQKNKNERPVSFKWGDFTNSSADSHLRRHLNKLIKENIIPKQLKEKVINLVKSEPLACSGYCDFELRKRLFQVLSESRSREVGIDVIQDTVERIAHRVSQGDSLFIVQGVVHPVPEGVLLRFNEFLERYTKKPDGVQAANDDREAILSAYLEKEMQLWGSFENKKLAEYKPSMPGYYEIMKNLEEPGSDFMEFYYRHQIAIGNKSLDAVCMEELSPLEITDRDLRMSMFVRDLTIEWLRELKIPSDGIDKPGQEFKLDYSGYIAIGNTSFFNLRFSRKKTKASGNEEYPYSYVISLKKGDKELRLEFWPGNQTAINLENMEIYDLGKNKLALEWAVKDIKRILKKALAFAGFSLDKEAPVGLRVNRKQEVFDAVLNSGIKDVIMRMIHDDKLQSVALQLDYQRYIKSRLKSELSGLWQELAPEGRINDLPVILDALIAYVDSYREEPAMRITFVENKPIAKDLKIIISHLGEAMVAEINGFAEKGGDKAREYFLEAIKNVLGQVKTGLENSASSSQEQSELSSSPLTDAGSALDVKSLYYFYIKLGIIEKKATGLLGKRAIYKVQTDWRLDSSESEIKKYYETEDIKEALERAMTILPPGEFILSKLSSFIKGPADLFDYITVFKYIEYKNRGEARVLPLLPRRIAAIDIWIAARSFLNWELPIQNIPDFEATPLEGLHGVLASLKWSYSFDNEFHSLILSKVTQIAVLLGLRFGEKDTYDILKNDLDKTDNPLEKLKIIKEWLLSKKLLIEGQPSQRTGKWIDKLPDSWRTFISEKYKSPGEFDNKINELIGKLNNCLGQLKDLEARYRAAIGEPGPAVQPAPEQSDDSQTASSAVSQYDTPQTYQEQIQYCEPRVRSYIQGLTTNEKLKLEDLYLTNKQERSYTEGESKLSNIRAFRSALNALCGQRRFDAEFSVARGHEIVMLYDKSAPSSPLILDPVKNGGIDFKGAAMYRATAYEASGSFAGLDFSLPKLSSQILFSFNLDKEQSDIGRAIDNGILVSGQRIKEFIAASVIKGEFAQRKETVILWLAKLGILEEGPCYTEQSSREYKEALVIVDS
ncbi:MAG: hypothetical protein PHT50_07605 [Candidatus Omnitrophica bacterium]|nr:hypothetical protein [Candidatus Omnitrophota bacterium]